MKLSELKVGQKARILSINTKGVIRRRLMDMGVLSGEILRVEKIAPLGDPIDIVIKNYHLSLRKNESEGIEVEVLD
ncbi:MULTISPECIES: FeoA family protein [Thermodesulfovibrio]|uniref:Conserved domain protein n=2 Tax=Thermodesulfovibrio yellowstonii TaxID=28262 RepID=B5YKN3_THEYD|nr:MULTISPECIES: ferrous iron transport protein A [Thermodesulfovibrio]ACI21002.1 conserved domain protein [Thermodesulfovibrio yellowstonii DSM 11347]MDI6864264.1 ferrous iron transport protein A [Thermodesulfovibrio yellowstonii]GLI53517.1 iron transporter FeoA [Thermodesulfovibrio islandicus]